MRLLVLALPLLLLATPAASDQLTVYRCTDGEGQVALRDTPCPSGLREEAIDMRRPADPPPSPVVAAPRPQPAAPTPDVQTRVLVVEAPRPIYQCTTPDGERYTADTPDGNPRWVPMWTLGYPVVWPRNPLGDRVGAPRPEPPSNGPGPPDLPPLVGIAYTPGTWIRDHCVQLPRADACEVLRAEQRSLRTQWFNAMPTRRAEITVEERALEQRVARTCAG